MNGADLLAQTLASLRVEWISTLCGHGLNEVYAACGRAGIRLIDTRNEQTAAYMAESWGRMSGEVGVCAVSSGVAHANALTGVVNAHFDGAPMLLLTGAGPLGTAGMGHFQDFEQVALAAPVCKYARVLDIPDRIPEQVREAFESARSGRPGPVHLTFPMDVQEAEAEAVPPAPPRRLEYWPQAGEASVARAVKMLAAAERPLLVAGSGAWYSGAGDILADFCTTFAIPFVVPIWDRGCVVGRRAEFLGVIGAASGGPDLLGEADLLLLVGATADYRVGFLRPPAVSGEAAVIRIDIDPGRLHHLPSNGLAILADPAAALEQLDSACTEQQIRGFESWLAETRSRVDAHCREITGAADRSGRLNGLDVVEALAAAAGEEAVLIVDGGNIGAVVSPDRRAGALLRADGDLRRQRRRRLRHRGGHGGARRVPAASGGAAVRGRRSHLQPDRPRVRRPPEAPFLMVVADDESWGITEAGHLQAYGKAMSSHLGPVDFAAAARAFGALGTRVEDRGELQKALAAGLAGRGPGARPRSGRRRHPRRLREERSLVKITRIETAVVDAGWRPWLFVRVETDTGVTGYGECSDGKNPLGVAGAIDDLKPLLLGADPAPTKRVSRT